MSFSIIKPGFLDSLQDLGIKSLSNPEALPEGPRDPFAAQVANLLVGNGRKEAVLEIQFPGPQILFTQNTLIAVTGGDFTPTINDTVIPRWQPVIVRRNTVLHFPALVQGSRCYISVHGGYCAERCHRGCRLEKGDELHYKESSVYFAGLLRPEHNFEVLPWRVNIEKIDHSSRELDILQRACADHLKSKVLSL